MSNSIEENNKRIFNKIIVDEFSVPAEHQGSLLKELIFLFSSPNQTLTEGQKQNARIHVQNFMNGLREVKQSAGSTRSAMDGGNLGSKLTESLLDKKDSKILELYEESKNKVFKDRMVLAQLDRDLNQASNSLATIIFRDQELLQLYQQKFFELRQPKTLDNAQQIAELAGVIANDLLKTQDDQIKRAQLLKIVSQTKDQLAQEITQQFEAKQQRLATDLQLALKYDLVETLYADSPTNPLQEVLKTGKIQVVPSQNPENKIGLDFIENTNPATQKQIAQENDLLIQRKKKENNQSFGIIDADSLLFDFGREKDQLGIIAQIASQFLRSNVKINDLSLVLKDLSKSNGALGQSISASQLTRTIYNARSQ